MRASGILLHISSLPSKYGIGTYGQSAYDFVDFLKKTGQTYWQILPLGPTSYGDSPYQTFSAFANNPYFIDLDILVSEKLLRKSEIKATVKDLRRVDYATLYQERFDVLKKAFKRFDLNDPRFILFVNENKDWVTDYALFMAIKAHYQGVSWSFWDEPIRTYDQAAVAYAKMAFRDEMNFHLFLQFKADQQWMALKKYANEQGILIVGDMPIYVSYDSSDVWANAELFDLDEQKRPNYVAGVPPDNFTKDGQLWGNPLYRWPVMEANGYAWWIKRVKAAQIMFDWVRIDHFIGFVNYYRVPFGEQTAKHGLWIKGPGLKVFEAIRQALGHVNIIAEDLGAITDEVRDVLKASGFPGMKIMQFAFDPKEPSDYLPHNYTRNTIVYTGTHDNETTQTWFNHLSEESLKYCLNYINHSGSKTRYVDSLIKATLLSISDTAIIPYQDYLRLTEEARMNIPSTLGNNWAWRAKRSDFSKSRAARIQLWTQLYGRENKKTE
ncbi:MAG: 4-alpha-glucanotransferase [Acholeplasmataceae bacterium]